MSPGAEGAGTDGPKPGSSALQTAVLANLVGRGWPMALAFLVVPFYLRYLGREAYALVIASATLQALCIVFDFGISATLTRELARTSDDPSSAVRARNLVRSFEIPYWTIAALLAAVSFAAAGYAAVRWLKPESIPPETVRSAALLMGLAVATQFPFNLYAAGLLGLQKQVRINGLIVGAATVRVAASLCVLEFVSPTIEAFLLCQVAVGALQTVAGVVALRAALPPSSEPARVDMALVRPHLRFAAGLAAIAAVSLILTQADKIVLTTILPLGEYTYYGIAASVAASLAAIFQPVFTAVFPRFSQVVAGGDAAEEAFEYHRACQLLSVLLLPPAVVLAWTSQDILTAWTGDPQVGANGHMVASLLVAGSALNGLMNLPYAMMLAHGWARLPLVTNIVAVVLLVPTLWMCSVAYGGVGAASVWLTLNCGYVLVSIPILHSRVLRGEMRRWYLRDVAQPLAGAVVGAALGLLLIPAADSRVGTFARAGTIVAVSFAGAVAVTPQIRRMLLSKLGRRRLGAS